MAWRILIVLLAAALPGAIAGSPRTEAALAQSAAGRAPHARSQEGGLRLLEPVHGPSPPPPVSSAAWHDDRWINTGRNISNGFGDADQPQVVVTQDGAWQCVLAVNSAHEGQGDQQVVSLRSTDQGATWEPPVLVEPVVNDSCGWINNLVVPATGRIYAFYTFNKDNVTTDPRTGKPLAKQQPPQLRGVPNQRRRRAHLQRRPLDHTRA